ncbi:MAG TPA: hypothetical protein DIT67_02520 [Octadecabacter sp.]|nr:hypothetical protein [Octadecabacter sp.]
MIGNPVNSSTLRMLDMTIFVRGYDRQTKTQLMLEIFLAMSATVLRSIPLLNMSIKSNSGKSE